MASAATSGWKMGGNGCALRGIRLRTQPNCGVLRAGRWTIVTATPLRSWMSSVRSDSVKPRSACFAAQYADCSGMLR